MDFGEVVRARLAELGRDQKELAGAAQVTESYVSQLLTRRKAPPAPERTDIYEKFERFLQLPDGRLTQLVDFERKAKLERELGVTPAALHAEVRQLVLHKCAAARQAELQAIFEKEPFGSLERLVTQKLLEAVKDAAKKELANKGWLREVARRSGRSYSQMRVLILEFLDTDVLSVSADHCLAFLDPLIESWDIELATFAMDIVLNRRLAPGHSRRLEFIERAPWDPPGLEPGLREFLRDSSMSGKLAEDELEFLKALRFKDKRPTPLYYYRALQNYRDPLHFIERSVRSTTSTT
jgi:transcriptional regulator with XRE-family HTH domain